MEPHFKLIVGLGNPGAEYRKTYHNLGHLAIDHLAEQADGDWARKAKRRGKFEYLSLDGKILVKPSAFMNESGGAVLAAAKFFKARPEDILIVHDDSDLEIGKCQLSFGRGSAGHKGVESIIKSLRGEKFWRLRIGIRDREAGRRRRTKAGDKVLKKISPGDLKILYGVFGGAIKNVIKKDSPAGVALISESGKPTD